MVIIVFRKGKCLTLKTPRQQKMLYKLIEAEEMQDGAPLPPEHNPLLSSRHEGFRPLGLADQIIDYPSSEKDDTEEASELGSEWSLYPSPEQALAPMGERGEPISDYVEGTIGWIKLERKAFRYRWMGTMWLRQ
jgi:hypothetical protein